MKINQAAIERRRKHAEEEAILIESSKRDRALKHGLKRDAKFEMAWNMAWSMGHSAGLSEVEQYFDDLAQLIKP
jgi:hypothetical protein